MNDDGDVLDLLVQKMRWLRLATWPGDMARCGARSHAAFAAVGIKPPARTLLPRSMTTDIFARHP
jgi:hypothetical protein